MRDIKFRVWDRDNKYMIESNQSVATIIHRNLCSGSWSWFSNCDLSTPENYKERYIVMQYTWLKDMNWKEVYEGDIVEARSQWYKWVFQIKWRQDATPCYILYPARQNREQWHISASEHKAGKQRIWLDWKVSTDNSTHYSDGWLTVIWNIYENPDLLTKN